MNKILALWGTPRGTTTAFSWMMSARGDFECIHEPFARELYTGDYTLVHNDTGAFAVEKINKLENALKKICESQEKNSTFIKDFPYCTELLWKKNFNDLFHHSFLIRHPARALASYYDRNPNFTIKESGFIHLRQYFDQVKQQHRHTPAVIDSDDMLESPNKIIKRWCEYIGIDYLEQALSWDQKKLKEPQGFGYFENGRYSKNIKRSKGIERQSSKILPNISNLPIRIQDMYHEVMPHYEYLYQFRLQPTT